MDAVIATLSEELARAGQIVEVGPSHVTLDVGVKGFRRPRRLDVSIGRRRGEPWVVVTAPVGPLADFDTAAALAENGALAAASLGAVGDLLVARMAGPLARFDVLDGVRELALLSCRAGHLARPDGTVESLFAHYT